ncbi:hypothetical protein BC629DRAFT_1460351 [Irpex lacteus]|nr:hypothetical protein BC629DRAFT_1460351 [Irpex lacteus]
MLLQAEVPPEIVLTILSHLPLQSLHALRRLSHEWLSWVDANRSYIYQRAALKHNFIPSTDIALPNAVLASKHLLPDSPVGDWGTFCRLRFTLEAKWAGIGVPAWAVLSEDHADVHRIKVDEDVGIVITTHKDGGINVRDLYTDEVLWALPRTYVQRYAHCEYENGFLIWNRDDSKEVWRLASQYESSPAPRDELQELISFTINRYMPTSKGHFKPWALLTPPETGNAFRFVYPTLAVVGVNAAWLFDVERAQMVKTINYIQKPVAGGFLGAINYVELSDQHVLMCGSSQLRFFDRSSGAIVHAITREDVTSEESKRQGITFHRHTDSLDGGWGASLVGFHPGVAEPDATDELEFVAAHVDRTGKAVVAMLSDSRLFVISDIGRYLAGTGQVGEAGLALQVAFHCPAHEPLRLPPRGIYLAVEHGRVGVITNFGVFLITLDATSHGLTEPGNPTLSEKYAIGSSNLDSLPHLPLPYLKTCRLLPFSSWAPLSAVTCLQMTARRLLFTWSRYYVPQDSETTDTVLEVHSNGDTIAGYDANGGKILVSMDDLVALFANMDSFERIEEAEGGDKIVELIHGAAQSIVLSIDFSQP